MSGPGAGARGPDGVALMRSGAVGARRGVVEIVLGTVVGQGVLVAVAPVLSRLYTPADFALLQIFTGVVSVGAVLASLRLELAIPLTRDVRETRAVLRSGLVATVVVAVLVWVAGLVTARWWASGTTLLALRGAWWLVPVTVVAVAAFQLVSAILVRAERYRDLAGRNAAQGLGTAAAQLGFGTLGFGTLGSGPFGTGPLGLLLGMSVGRVAGLATVARRPLLARSSDRSTTRVRVSVGDMAAAVSRYRNFPMISTWTALLNNAGQYAPYLVFTLTFGPNPTGWLAFTTRLLGLPAAVVGQAVAQVFLGRGASAQRAESGELPRLTWLAVRRLTLLGAGPALVLAATAPWLFGWVFGSEWERAGTYARVLAPAFLLQFVASPVSNVFNLVGRQALALAWEAVRVVLVVTAPLLVWWRDGSDLVGVGAYAACLVASYAGVLVLVRRVLRHA